MHVFVDFILVLLMFGESWFSSFRGVFGPIDVDDFQVSHFPLFSLCFWRISMFSGGLKQWIFDSRGDFKGKVSNDESTSWRHDFGGSPRARIMKCHDFNFTLFSLLILIVLVFWRAPNACFCWFYIGFTDVWWKLNFVISGGLRT